MDTTVDPAPSPMETTSLDPAGYAILCQGLTKRYGDVLALDHLDLAVPFGSIFGFLGRNGAGKTTTMRLLAGLALPTSGRAWVAGQETTGASRLARTRFGYLPQSPAFYTWMSAREYLDYIARIQGISAAERKRQVEELLALSELQNAARRKVGGFSGGMVQRLGIAQAFIGNPPVLLLDEPTSSLDPAGRYEVLDMIERLRGNTTVFLSSHILSDIERVCDTLAVLHEGRLLLVSGIEALLDRYPVDAVELELDAGNLAELEEVATQMTSALAPLPWVAKVTRQGAVIRVLVNDVPRGKQELLPLVASYRLSLNRYAWVRPSLEEIFLQISA